jgi:hypothetical protein
MTDACSYAVALGHCLLLVPRSPASPYIVCLFILALFLARAAYLRQDL